MPLPIGVTLPNYGSLASAANLTRLAQRAEAVGFDSVWVADHLVAPCGVTSIYPFDRRSDPTPAEMDGLVDFYEPLITLAYLAAATRRVRLGISVFIVPYRNPVVTAKMIATLDALSGGRVIFGVGVGWLREEFHAVAANPRVRGRVTDEYLEVCRRLWRDDIASFEGAHYHLPPVRGGPKPVQRPWPPIWIGGNSDAALLRAARFGDGLHLIDVSPEDIVPIAGRLEDRLRESGRPRAGFTVSLRKGVRVGSDLDGASRPLYGSAQKVRDDRDAYARAGVDYLVVSPRQAKSVEQLEAALEESATALL